MRYEAADRDWGRVLIRSHLEALKSALALRQCLGHPPPWTADQSQRFGHLPLALETQAAILQNSQWLTFLQPETKEETISEKEKSCLCPSYGKTVYDEQMILLKLTNPPHIN